ncbi:MAG: histidine phosphatase family protein [Planctomycetota bacterium]
MAIPRAHRDAGWGPVLNRGIRERCFCSPLTRARQTAHAIGESTGLSVEIDENMPNIDVVQTGLVILERFPNRCQDAASSGWTLR